MTVSVNSPLTIRVDPEAFKRNVDDNDGATALAALWILRLLPIPWAGWPRSPIEILIPERCSGARRRQRHGHLLSLLQDQRGCLQPDVMAVSDYRPRFRAFVKQRFRSGDRTCLSP